MRTKPTKDARASPDHVFLSMTNENQSAPSMDEESDDTRNGLFSHLIYDVVEHIASFLGHAEYVCLAVACRYHAAVLFSDRTLTCVWGEHLVGRIELHIESLGDQVDAMVPLAMRHTAAGEDDDEKRGPRDWPCRRFGRILLRRTFGSCAPTGSRVRCSTAMTT